MKDERKKKQKRKNMILMVDGNILGKEETNDRWVVKKAGDDQRCIAKLNRRKERRGNIDTRGEDKGF